MKDNFSTQAQGYAKYRPYYPAEMIAILLRLRKTNNSRSMLLPETGRWRLSWLSTLGRYMVLILVINN